ncbi:response regulator transcription factor [Pigmentiphaga aceris]|uniref:Response regulator transcription factor n=1 Tax=Pigmentiphaga aceris TaxID=1940612 RepID=A0A5C0ARM4_9BURK|nr:response regulator transcription factor [Pigmentiphaga aceris]QEI04779.1 response regulator transcription factor [Pigmentiphaga aceris]
MKANLDPITVLVAHAEPFVAIGVAAVLREQGGLDVALCKGACPLDATDQQVSGRTADVVVTDYDSGMALLASRRDGANTANGPRVMMLTHKAREQDVRIALEAGAHGYVLLDCPVEEVADGMRALKCGVRYLCAAAARSMADSLTREALTPRELDVLVSLARGNCNKLIATELDLAVGTIKIHLKALMAKMSARSRTQVVTTAMARGLIPASGPATAEARAVSAVDRAQTERRGVAYLPRPVPASTGRMTGQPMGQATGSQAIEAAATPPRPARYFAATSRPVAWLR